MPIYKYKDFEPQLAKNVYVSPSADLIGRLEVGEDCSFWFNVTVRADVNFVKIGKQTNIQDGSVIHVTTDTNPTIVGDKVTIGHNVNLHGCTIQNLCLIGIGAIVLDGAVVEEKAFVAANCLVPPKKVVPAGTLFAGSPGKIVRDLTPKELEFFEKSAARYVNLKNDYLNAN